MRLHICFLAALALAGCGKKPSNEGVEAASKPAEPPVVKVAHAEVRQIQRAISVTGSLLPDESVNLAFEVPGTVERVLVDFGQTARKGQVIAELDKRETRLVVERSQAALTQALARVGLSPDEVNGRPESTPAIRQALAQLEDARSKYESAERLVKSGDISRERYTELDKSLRAREAAVQIARDELRTQLASIQAIQADFRLAEKRLGDTVIRAPFDGAVTARMVSPGQYLKENTPVVTLVKSYPLRLRAELPETAVGSVHKGSSLSFVTDAAPEARFQAIVRELNPSLDAHSRSLTAEARLLKPDARLRPGMFVQVELVVAAKAKVIAVPKEALYTIAGLTKLFVIRDGQVVELKIQPGEEVQGWITIPEGLGAGDQVATSNLPMLVQGMKVKVQG
jgi:RND family efflux transporter MFP subunit